MTAFLKNTMTILETGNGKIEWLEDYKSIFKSFTGFIFGEELRKIFDAGYEKFHDTDAQTWISDNRLLQVYKQEDVDWINEDWLPRMLKSGWKYWAIIEPEKTIGKMSMKKFAYYEEKGIEVKVFSDEKEALRWSLDKC